jgi:nitrate reductase NapA
MTRLDRRTFLKGVGIASAASVAPGSGSAFAAVSGVPLPASAPAWRRTPCRLCGVGCGLLVGIEGGRAVAVKGDPDSPVSAGLACVKGYNSVQALYGRDRIRQAMVRRDGKLVPVPIHEAYDLVARQIRETMGRHGKDSVALYGSAQWTIGDAYIASKLFKGGLGTNNLDTSARLYAGSVSAGLRSTFGADGAIGCYEDIDHADTFVLWDINLAETDPVLFSRMLARRRANPAVRIVALSTRTARTEYAADQTLLCAPHAALPVANAVCQEIVDRGWANRDFLDQHVAFKRGKTDLGNGDAAGSLIPDSPINATWSDYVAFLAGYTPERVQAVSGLSAAKIRWLASLYGDPMRRVMSVWGRSVNQDVRGTWTNNALYNIHLLVGKIATPGNSAFAITGQPSNGSAPHDAGTLTGTLPRGRVDDEVDRRRAAEIWGVPLERIDPAPSAPLLSMFRQLERGDIRFLWIQATNPMMSLPNLDRYRRAAARAGTFVVVSEAYPTPTTDIADVVLPAAMWFEREGVFINVERRAQYFSQMVVPPGDATSDAWQMIEVARRLDLAELFPYQPSNDLAQIWDEYSRFHAGSGSALPPLAELRAQAGSQWPYADGHETRWRYSTTDDPSADAALGDVDFYGHDDHRAWIWLRPEAPAAEVPDTTYPFWLTTGAVLEQWGAGAMTQRIPTLHRALPHGYVEVNREDAQALGIRNRERVRLVSRRGALEIEARIDYRSQPPRGLLFAPVFDEGEPVNRLMLDAYCPISGQPDGSKCAVRIERLSARSAS